MAFVKASRQATKLRLALQGPAGSGKTRTALEIMRALLALTGQRIAVVDTEQGSASKYEGINGLDFDVDEIFGNYHPSKVGKAIKEAEAGGYGGIIFDSLTHFWNGPGGFLQLVDEEVSRMKARGNKPDSFAAWKVIDPIYKTMVQEILNAPIHVIVCLRAKTEYEKTEGDNGRSKIRKVGMAPEIRDTFQYEMDVEGMLDMDHTLVIGKTRIDLLDGKIFKKAGKDFADIYHQWASTGAAVKPRSVPPADASQPMIQDVGSAMERDVWIYRINLAGVAEELRGFLPAMKAAYVKMTPTDVQACKDAYTNRANALKVAAAAASTPSAEGTAEQAGAQ